MPPERKPILVIVPFYKDRVELDLCLKALSEQNVKTKVYVRDNSSDNILYTKAINEGLRKFAFSGEFDFILILTQDVVLKPGALEELVRIGEENDKAGIVSPVQVDPKGSFAWAGSLAAYPRGCHLGLKPGSSDCYPTYWANGACLLLKTQMIWEIGIFDENMLFVFSDCDYSFTARARGWQVLVAPHAVCEHYLKGSAATASPELKAVKLADQVYFSAKWLSGDLYRSLGFEAGAVSRRFVAHHFDSSIKDFRNMEHSLENASSEFLSHSAHSIMSAHENNLGNKHLDQLFCAELDPAFVVKMDLAICHHRQENFVEAAGLYREILGTYPGNCAINRLLGLLLGEVYDVDNAVGHLFKAVEEAKKFSQPEKQEFMALVYKDLGNVFLKVGRFNDAVEFYHHSFSLSTSSEKS